MSRHELIFRNLDEILGEEKIKNKILNNEEILSYIGFAPTGKVHLGYLVPCMKICDLTRAGCKVAILIADVHALLDERRTPENKVSLRSLYYKNILTFILEYMGADMSNIFFTKGSDFQYTQHYNKDVWDLCRKVTISSAKKAGSEVVKQDKDPNLGSVIYPIMQAIDEKHVSIAFS